MSTPKRPDVVFTTNGPPVLLIQGIGVVGGCWRPQVDALQGRFQTLVFAALTLS